MQNLSKLLHRPLQLVGLQILLTLKHHSLVNEPVISILFVVDLTLPVVANIPLPPPLLIPKLVVWNDAELSVPA